MGKREKTAEEWYEKMMELRERLQAYAGRYAREQVDWHMRILEADIEKCARSLANAKKQHEMSKIRESQSDMFE